jgi:hypothetical protein
LHVRFGTQLMSEQLQPDVVQFDSCLHQRTGQFQRLVDPRRSTQRRRPGKDRLCGSAPITDPSRDRCSFFDLATTVLGQPRRHTAMKGAMTEQQRALDRVGGSDRFDPSSNNAAVRARRGIRACAPCPAASRAI